MQRKKVVHQLDTPFSTVQWPEISQEDQDTILELLCDLLGQLGQHRRDHIKVSKGKKARAQELKKGEPAQPVESPPIPEVAAYVDVGLSNVTRVLESLASAPDASPYYSAIFCVRGQTTALISHLPHMVFTASRPSREVIRLVGLSKACEERLSASLGIPRASVIGLREGAPQAEALLEVLKRVPAIEASWLQEGGKEGNYIATKIISTTTTIGEKKPRLG